MKSLIKTILILFLPVLIFAQEGFLNKKTFTEADTLRGMLRPERTCYDVNFYDIFLKIDPKEAFIKGYVDIYFEAKADFDELQIDLFENMTINQIVMDKVAVNKIEEIELKYNRKFNAVFVEMRKIIRAGERAKFRIYYEGNPIVAKRAPWDGGFVWGKDKKGKDWIGVACEGTGASLWWPNKDHLSDEPDSLRFTTVVPKGLMSVSNGNLEEHRSFDKTHDLFTWKVNYPINNYNLSLNIANYAHFSDTYIAEDGEELALDYYVLSYNEEKAKKHFKQVHKTLSCFEQYFGKYPFWEDGYALIETPYLGMEHQSGIAYGNQYKRGYLGGMIPKEFDFDYIIVHETGHEYFGNSISTNDHAEMWIHESFTTYMETLFVECAHGLDASIRYINSQRSFIMNEEPIIGPMDVNFGAWASSDHYFKGAWILHTLRHTINDDQKWFKLLRSFYEKYKISNVQSEDFFNYVNAFTGKNYNLFFKQYLQKGNIPTLEYKIRKKGKRNCILEYRWVDVPKGFMMPIKMGDLNEYTFVDVTENWQKIKLNVSVSDFSIAEELFLINVKNIDD